MNDNINITMSTLRSWLENDKKVYVLDVRLKSQREEWQIPGSVHWDEYDRIKQNDPAAFDSFELSDEIPVVAVCNSGNASRLAAKRLREKGIEAYSLENGMKGWSSAWNSATIHSDDSTSIIQLRRTGKGCLSYIIGSEDEAIVIDPSLDPELYTSIASENDWQIKYVLDTHIHADHLSRAKALGGKTGAQVMLPAQNRLSYSFKPLADKELLKLGSSELEVIYTPGHTHESACYFLNKSILFTGDTLFTDGVGRPDLKATNEEVYQRAKHLYYSLQGILTLPGETKILPGHTSRAVPFDGKPIYALLKDLYKNVSMLNLSEEEFIETIVSKIPNTPPNYSKIVALNLVGDLDNIETDELEAGANRCAIN